MPSSPAVAEQISRLELVVQREAGRSIGPLAAAARGGLLAAAAAIAGDPASHVAFVTGCFVPRATPPACETDGPVGAALAAASLGLAGVPARLVTDSRCAAVVRAAAEEAGAAAEEAGAAAAFAGAAPPVHVGDEPGTLARELSAAGVTHVVFVERLGPGADGVVRNMHGDDVTAVTPPLHALAAAGPWVTTGIGDGGNEVGMGALAPRLVAATVAHGERIRCAVACDHLIVAGISNWGALALALAVGLLRGAAASVAAVLSPAAHDAVLTAAVGAGAVDGVLGEPSATVDGLAPAQQRQQLEALSACV
ncbi:glutamate cyclase domain-containing protein [Conexibacter stalactiti]|uniref:DUF4392 domain-containing protein n=1 Tax=Conexibacter stalactiti TaxID=1940611 RepID=A0ABU4HPT3_9ACTN|nr:glutamate cyclase domain-containing protein [Conexibacter stalactiti]MDW5594712.1 DUF4392 domain-containing protein [Conexibacter stalactiti]MEC5035354.1 glutamate cyclase domain-containing protein [Conexibacter stalactiti]